MKRIALALATVGVMALGAAPAWATHTEGPPECVTIVDEEGYTTEGPIQRYSYTGGPSGLDESGTPATLPPSEDWQANTTTYNDGTSHGGNLGLYFVSHGNSGNGDWFYWEVGTVVVPPVTHEECHDADPDDPKDPKDPEEPKTPIGESPRRTTAHTGPAADIAGIAMVGLGFGISGAALWKLAGRRLR